MKKLLILLLILVNFNAFASQQLTYFVYTETEFFQGPWVRAEMVDRANSKYLEPIKFNDLFGTIEEEIAEKMLQRLKSISPKKYTWKYELTIIGDTVLLKSPTQIEECVSVKNEITATMVLNGFTAVKFDLCNSIEIWTLDKLTLPYLDLITYKPTRNAKIEEIQDPLQLEGITPSEEPIKIEQSNFFWIAFILSAMLNIILFALLIARRKA